MISREVLNVLNRIYLVGVAYKGCPPPLYVNAKKTIENLDKSIANIYAKSVNHAPFAWKRDNMLVLRVGNLMFAYSKSQSQQGEIIVAIHEVFKNNQIVTELRKK